MPPQTRKRASKVLKENVEILKKTKVTTCGKIKKPPRKALADKTNSLSDDNESIDVPIKTKLVVENKAVKSSNGNVRPRRDRKLPSRFVENQVLNNLSNSKNTPEDHHESTITATNTLPNKPLSKEENKKQPTSKNEVLTTRPKRISHLQSVKEAPFTKAPETPTMHNVRVSSPFKTPSQSVDTSLIANRPKRIHRLPSRFEDHSISPNKFIPVQPCYASTPLVQRNVKPFTDFCNDGMKSQCKENNPKGKDKKNMKRQDKDKMTKKIKSTKGIDPYFCTSHTKALNTSSSSKEKNRPDTNNNAKRVLPRRGQVHTIKSAQHGPKLNVETAFSKRLLDKSLSFRVFEDKKESDKNLDVYEFTFDPNEEPQPQKKKRKKPMKKRPPKAKIIMLKNNYDQNVGKTLESLRSKVNKPPESSITQPCNVKPITQTPNTELKTQKSQKDHPQTQLPNQTQVLTHTLPQIAQLKTQPQAVQPVQTQNVPTVVNNNGPKKIQIIENIVFKPANENKILNCTAPDESVKNSVHMSNYASIRVEDIAADFELDPIKTDINYSPVNSPCRPKTPDTYEKSHLGIINKKDPLNLQEESFFDDHPVASSSMNVSVRHPNASPWRVEFSNLPIKWQADTYVKPNMTPAVECSFIKPEDTQKKHVYTNLIANDDPLPFIEDPPQLKQPSIISFMRECAEKSLKKRHRSVTPKKVNSLFEDTQNTNEFGDKTPKKARKEKVLTTPNAFSSSNDTYHEKENYNQNHEFNKKDTSNENNSHHNDRSPVKKTKTKDKDGTFFGFDDSDNIDQENVSPLKKIQNTRARGLRAKSRAVLKEINTLSGPTRVAVPVSTKAMLASSEAVNQLYDQLKSAEDTPLFPEKEKRVEQPAATNIDETLNEDDESVHLFEDIELIHHLKPQRKSYGKAKKVTFQQRSTSDSDSQIVPEEKSSDEDDLGDLTFQMPNIQQQKVRKKKPKKQLSKKEVKEVEEWAAGFNSMCEDVEGFELVFD